MSIELDLKKLVENLGKVADRLDKAARQQEIGMVMQQLLVLQLDGKLTVGSDTMKLYFEVLAAPKTKIKAFRKHITEKYMGE